VSFEFKKIVKAKFRAAKSEQDLDKLLNDLHDAVLEAKNNPDGLRAAVKILKN
jgi:hypothetical protein